MSKSIIVVLQGGLGNQLFQYTAGLTIASCEGGQLWLNPAEQNKHSGKDYRLTLYKKGNAVGIHGTPTENHVYYQQADAFDSWKISDYKNHASIIIKGYYQYLPAIEKYVDIICNDILEGLSKLRYELEQKYKISNMNDCYFIHIRRGDYLTQPPNTLFVQDNEYYNLALTHINKSNDKKKRWFVLSDDIEWCRQQEWLQGEDFEIINEPDELYGLMLMSLCHGGAIIANSTYSWWGAMLGSGKNSSYVYYPSKWCGDKNPNLFPFKWNRI